MEMRVKVLQLERWMIHRKESIFYCKDSFSTLTKIPPIFNRNGWYRGTARFPIENVPSVKVGSVYKFSWFENGDESYSSLSLLESFDFNCKSTPDAIITKKSYDSITGVLEMKGIPGKVRSQLLEMKTNHLLAVESIGVVRRCRLFMLKSSKTI